MAIVDDEDVERIYPFRWIVLGGSSSIVRCVYIDKHTSYIPLANEVLKDYSKQIYDHIDRDKFNNKRDNLRPCTRQQNCFNTAKHKHSVSKYKGVTPRKDMWRAQITKDYKKYHIGTYCTEEEAALAYNEKAKELFGEFANLNIICQTLNQQ